MRSTCFPKGAEGMNLSTLLVSAALVLILAGIALGAVRARKKGKSICGCSAACSAGCSGACSAGCGHKPSEEQI